MKFTGTQGYVATDDLTIAVNAAVTLETSATGQRRTWHWKDRAGPPSCFWSWTADD